MIKNRNARLHFATYFTVFFFLGLFLTPSVLKAQISGNVFRDININGIYDLGEYPEAGIRVVAYNANGDSLTQVTTTAALDGSGDNYSFTGLTLPIRLEFRVPAYLYSSKGSVGSTTVQFYSAVNSSADLAIDYPSSYCQTDPNVIVPCYVSGDPAGGGTAGSLDALVSFSYSKFGNRFNSSPPDHIAAASEIGTVWGSAYQRESKKLILSSFLKRHSGLHAMGLGGLFLGDMTTAPGSIASYIDIENFGIDLGGSLIAARATLPAVATVSSADPLVFNQIGKVGIGGIDLSDDGKVLWGVNLYTKTIFSFQIGSPVKPAGTVTSADFASFNIPNPGCTNGVSRPWGIQYYEGKIYVGTICSGETAGTASNLFAYVYRFDPTTNIWDAAPVLSFALNYTKGKVITSPTGINVGDWEPWANTWADIHLVTPSPLRKMRPQPILSDIQFDKRGNLILGFMDRTGHQTGMFNMNTAGDSTNFSGYIGGDILYLKNNGSGYTLESNGSVSGQTGSGVGNGQGPGGGEFFAFDYYSTTHQETMQGGLMYHPGRDEIMASHMDPLNLFSGGVIRHSVANGSSSTDTTMRYQIFKTGNTGSNNPGTYGKAAGLGAPEMACDPAPLEIGNRVWTDTNKNGKQDADEVGIDGVTVDLYQGTTKVGTATTANGGQYYFTAANVNLNGATGLLNNTAYEIRIANAQVPLSSLLLTTTDANSNGSDMIDSDGTTSGTNAIKAFTTGGAGQNNHSYDFGFEPSVSCPTSSCIPVSVVRTN